MLSSSAELLESSAAGGLGILREAKALLPNSATSTHMYIDEQISGQRY